ncbi:MAG TPA: hypothetical protein VIK74_03400 [Parasegetibacter sp.]
MMKIKYFFTAIMTLSIAFLAGCKKDSFNYQMYEANVADIDSIYFSAGDVMMIADGKAQLQFIVETYKRFQRKSGEVTREFVDYRELPEGSLKIFEEVTNKQIDGMTFSIATMPADTLRFYAQVGNVKSEVKKVALRPKPTLPPKVYVDVIFHAWELNPANRQYDVSSYQPIEYEKIVEALRVMNEVVNNRIGNAANGASANIEFRLATKNPQGQSIPLPGYNKIVYSDEVKQNPLSATISAFDFAPYITANWDKFIWDYKNYLNIHLIPSGANNSLSGAYPPNQLAPGPGESMIPGITAIAANEDDFPRTAGNLAVMMPHTLLYPGYERRIEIFNYVGQFYGLYPTSSYSTARYHSDYCEDTREYNTADPRNNFNFPIKVGINGDKFLINNAMDDIRYPSLRNSITLDQVNRMRAVMEKCPGRMNAKPI